MTSPLCYLYQIDFDTGFGSDFGSWVGLEYVLLLDLVQIMSCFSFTESALTVFYCFRVSYGVAKCTR
jgi:hypothetical protein